MIVRRLSLPLPAALLLLAAGCATAPAGSAFAAGEAAARAVTEADLLGEWRLARIGSRAVPSGGTFTLTFAAGGQATGTINCNTFSGRYRVEAGRIVFSESEVTAMGCRGAPDLAVAEQAVFRGKGGWLTAEERRLAFVGGKRVEFARVR
jgi:heat shock protein HslJ